MLRRFLASQRTGRGPDADIGLRIAAAAFVLVPRGAILPVPNIPEQRFDVLDRTESYPHFERDIGGEPRRDEPPSPHPPRAVEPQQPARIVERVTPADRVLGRRFASVRDAAAPDLNFSRDQPLSFFEQALDQEARSGRTRF